MKPKLKRMIVSIVLGCLVWADLSTKALADGNESSGGGDSSVLVYDGKRVNTSNGQITIVPKTDFFIERTCVVRYSECRSTHYPGATALAGHSKILYHEFMVGVGFNGTVTKFSRERRAEYQSSHFGVSATNAREIEEKKKFVIELCQSVIQSEIETYGLCAE